MLLKFNYLKLLKFTGLVLAIFILQKNIDFALVLEAWFNADKYTILTAISLLLLFPILGSLRWFIIVRSFDCNVRLYQIIQSVMLSFFANFFLPAKVGDLSKPLLTKCKASKTDLTISVVLERLCDLAALFGIALLGSYFTGFLKSELFSVLILLIGCILILRSSLIKRLKVIVNSEKLNVIFSNVELVISSKKKIFFFAFILCLVSWTLASYQITLFYRAFGVDIEFESVMGIFPLTVFITLIPITPGGVGVREISYLILFAGYADASVSALVGSIYYLTNNVTNAVFGALFLPFVDLKILQRKD